LLILRGRLRMPTGCRAAETRRPVFNRARADAS
jgi:hypothetical protein